MFSSSWSLSSTVVKQERDTNELLLCRFNTLKHFNLLLLLLLLQLGVTMGQEAFTSPFVLHCRVSHYYSIQKLYRILHFLHGLVKRK